MGFIGYVFVLCDFKYYFFDGKVVLFRGYQCCAYAGLCLINCIGQKIYAQVFGYACFGRELDSFNPTRLIKFVSV